MKRKQQATVKKTFTANVIWKDDDGSYCLDTLFVRTTEADALDDIRNAADLGYEIVYSWVQ